MGYVHNTHMTQYVPPSAMYGDTATWAMKAGQVSGTIAYGCDATDETANLHIPITILSNSVDAQGAYLVSIEVDFEILVAACDSVTAYVNKVTRGADGADATVTALTFDYDTDHDTAAERLTLDEHKMTLTLDDPLWIDNDEYILVKIAFDKAATSTVEALGAFANFTLRV